MFKRLIFVEELTAPKDNDIRSRILTIMEQNPKTKLQNGTEGCQRIINVNRENTRIEKNNPTYTKDKTTKRSPKSKEKIINTKLAGVKITREVTIILKIRYASNAGGKATKLQYIFKKKAQQ